MEEVVKIIPNTLVTPSKGMAGLRTQVSGGCVTVSAVAAASGGFGKANLIKSDTK